MSLTVILNGDLPMFRCRRFIRAAARKLGICVAKQVKLAQILHGVLPVNDRI